jgi:hypothetical protein
VSAVLRVKRFGVDATTIITGSLPRSRQRGQL